MRPSPRALLPFLLALVTHSLGCADTAAVPDCTADMEAEVCAVFQLVNQERVDRGLAPYAWNRELALASQRHAAHFPLRELPARTLVALVEPAVADQITGDKWNRYIFRTARNSTQDSLAAAATLDSVLDSGSAEAQPTLWYGSACAFLQPPAGSTSWWTANNWTNTTFYQISDRVRPASGNLQVNGTGNHRVVAISAGRALGSQNRATRTSGHFG